MRFAFALLLTMALTLSSLAQNSYMIRLDTEANLRASYSMDSELVARAPQGTELTVHEHFNRWLKVSYEGSEVWLADWVMHTRLSDDDSMPMADSMMTMPAMPADNMAYYIHLLTQTNLRELHSLESDIVAVLAEGSVLNVVDSFNRWLKVEHEDGHAWMAEWVQHERLTDEEVSDMFAPPPTVMYVDNCCQLGRECETAAHWIGGHLDFLAGMCPLPADTDEMVYDSPDYATLMDNCCLMGQTCETTDDWQAGYYDYARDKCGTEMMMMDDSSMSMNSMDMMMSG